MLGANCVTSKLYSHVVFVKTWLKPLELNEIKWICSGTYFEGFSIPSCLMSLENYISKNP